MLQKNHIKPTNQTKPKQESSVLEGILKEFLKVFKTCPDDSLQLELQ